jgi:capsular exopolysaccharide synthesis family protein
VPSTPSDPIISLGPEESVLEQLLQFWIRVRRRWWVVVVAAVVGGAVAFFRTTQEAQVYRASVQLLVDSRPPRVLGSATDVNPEEQMADRERFMNSQIRVLTSQMLSNRVEKRLGVPPGSLAGMVQASQEHTSYAMEIAVSDLDPDKATVYVKAFADEFLAMTVQDRTGVAADAAKFLGGQADGERVKLEGDEKALFDFNRANELPGSNFDESHKISSTALSSLHGQAAEARSTNIKLRAELTELEAAQGNPALQRKLLERDKDAVGGTGAHYTSLVEQLQQLETRYGAQHPKVVEVRQALDSVTKMMAEDLATSVSALKAKLRANENEMVMVQRAIAEETKKAVALRQKELEYNQLKRRLDEDHENYATLAKREKEIELQSVVKQSYVRWLEGPNAAAPVSRQFPRNMAAGVVLGLLLGLCLAFLIDLIDDTVKSPVEAERDLPPALLGIMMTVPVPAGTPKPQLEAVRAEHLVRNPRSMVAEQCHTLATHVYSLFLDGPPRALMVVSSAVEDGKTLVAVNLALTFAARGKRVLLVDGDLRRGRLHKLFQLPKKGGLFELVTQTLELGAAKRSTFIPNVDVVTTGDVPDVLSPLRVFEHKEMAAVVENMKAQYDLVVFDTAPVPLVSDALLLAPLIDGAVSVARAGKTTRKMAHKLGDQLQAGRVELLGWVLNDVPESELKSKYYYRYGYYGRGYYTEKPKTVGVE